MNLMSKVGLLVGEVVNLRSEGSAQMGVYRRFRTDSALHNVCEGLHDLLGLSKSITPVDYIRYLPDWGKALDELGIRYTSDPLRGCRTFPTVELLTSQELPEHGYIVLNLPNLERMNWLTTD